MAKSSTPASPSLPSEAVARVLRGGKKMSIDGKVNLSENGLEDLDQFWNSAKTPKPVQPKKQIRRRQPLKQENRKNKQVKEKRPPRFSLDGNEGGDGEEAVQDVAVFQSKLKKGSFSPGELSHVTTAPPTPRETPEQIRRASLEEKESVAATLQREATPESRMPISPSAPEDDFPMDDDDDDDLLPPPPPQEDMESKVPVSNPPDDFELPAEVDDKSTTSLKAQQEVSPTPQEDSTVSEASAKSTSSKQKTAIEDDNDDDKEGPGFEMVSSPIAESSRNSTSTERTPQHNKKRGRPRKSSIEKKPPTKIQRKKKLLTREKILFSPPGRPVGPREMQPVPVSDYKETPPEGVRRSRRAKMAPLAYWKNERPLYGPHQEEGELAEVMGCMPVVVSVLQAGVTPRKERKVTFSEATRKQRINATAAAKQQEEVFDSTRLRKKFKFSDGENAVIWDEAMEDAVDTKVVSYADNLHITDLPIPPTRKKSEGKVVGRAAQSFNVPSSGETNMVGYIMGNLVLPPKGIKDPESTGSCSQVFTVCNCQPKSIEIAYGDPNEEEGSLNVETAQRFLLSSGDQFRVPPGNAYRLHNHSNSTVALLAWTIIRPLATGS